MTSETNSAIFFTENYLLRLFNNKIPRNENGTITYRELHDFIQDKDDLVIPKRVRNVIKKEAESKGEDDITERHFIDLIMNEKYSNRFEKYLNIYMEFLIPPPQPPPTPVLEQERIGIPRLRMTRSIPYSESLKNQPRFERQLHFVARPAGGFISTAVFEDEIEDLQTFSEDDDEISLKDFIESRQRIYHFWPLPLAMILISLSEIILYTIDAVHGLNWWNGIISKELIYNPSRRIEMWRYLTYMFVHSGVWHLSMNIIFQLLLGSPLELHYNWRPISIVYCCGVISGALGSSVINSYAWLAGASGGVYALLTAHIVSIIMNWKRVNHRKFLLMFLLLFVLVDILRVIIDYLSGNLNHTISYASHFFGGLSGVLIGTVVFKQFTPEGKGKKIIYVLVIIFITLAGSAVFYNIFSTNTFPKQII